MTDKPTTPKVKKPPQPPPDWALAPILPHGDHDGQDVFAAVGMALTAWEKLEQAQANVFGQLVGSRRGGAVAAYGTIVAYKGRAEMLTAAAKVVLKGDPPIGNASVLAELLTLIKETGELSGRRNDIAHGIVSHFKASVTGADGVRTETDHGCYLVPASYATNKRTKRELSFNDPIMLRGTYAFTADQMLAYAGHFEARYKRMVDLIFKLMDHFQKIEPHSMHRSLEGLG